MRKKQFSYFSFQIFFAFWAKLFETFGQIFKKLWKLPSACPQEQLVASNFFKTVWTVLDFLQKPLAWFSNFFLRVQSKNCGRKSFLIFLFRIFSDFERKFFQTFSQKTSKSPQNYLLRVQRNSLWLEFFFLKFWIVLDFLQKPSAWFSNFYLRVKSKNCGRTSFPIFLFRFFRILSENLSDFRQKNFKKLSKLPSACPAEQFVAWNIFWKFWIVLIFSAETFGMVLKFLSTCPE